jgi:hypothetical protein
MSEAAVYADRSVEVDRFAWNQSGYSQYINTSPNNMISLQQTYFS